MAAHVSSATARAVSATTHPLCKLRWMEEPACQEDEDVSGSILPVDVRRCLHSCPDIVRTGTLQVVDLRIT